MYYTVTFNSQGHGAAPETQYIEVLTPKQNLHPGSTIYPMMGMLATEPDPLVDEEYKFLGWFADTIQDREWDFEKDLVYRSMILYAGWQRAKPYWHGNRTQEQYIFRKVARATWQEHETYNYITSGSVEQSADADTKVTGSLSFEGYEIPDPKDLIRIYYRFKDQYGLTAETAIATLVVSYPKLTYMDTLKGIKAEGTLECSSVLNDLEEKKIGTPKTIPKSSNAVYEAEQLIRGEGLQTNAEPSSANLSADHTFEPGTSYLEMVNWLLNAAGYTEAFPDPYGVVQLLSYATAQQRTDYAVFANNDESIMYPKIEEENEWQTSPNVVRLIYNTDDACIAAWAENVSGSRASLEERGGREVTFFEEVSELSGTSKANALKELAEQELLQQSCDTEYVRFEHAYKPISIYDPVKIMYSDMEWTGNAENISIELSPAAKTQTRVKRVLINDIEVRSGAEVYRGD